MERVERVAKEEEMEGQVERVAKEEEEKREVRMSMHSTLDNCRIHIPLLHNVHSGQHYLRIN